MRGWVLRGEGGGYRVEGVYKHDNTRGDTTPQLTLRCRPALLMAVIVTWENLQRSNDSSGSGSQKEAEEEEEEAS